MTSPSTTEVSGGDRVSVWSQENPYSRELTGTLGTPRHPYVKLLFRGHEAISDQHPNCCHNEREPAFITPSAGISRATLRPSPSSSEDAPGMAIR